jgi:SagB-type dehydrogenase family enzyme
MKILPLFLIALFMTCQGGSVGDSYELPQPVNTNRSIEECMSSRRSVRSFTTDTLTPQQVSNLLWAAQGITDTNRGLRTVPSAGATYPLEIYLLASHGIFRFEPKVHSLSVLKLQDSRQELANACYGQPWVAGAQVSFVLCAVPERTSGRYGDRAMRYILLEAGHAAQNMLLEAVAMNLGGVPIGAFDDKKISNLIGLDTVQESTIPLYIISIGVPAREK